MANAGPDCKKTLFNCLRELQTEINWWHFNPTLRQSRFRGSEYVDRLLRPLLDHTCEDLPEATAKVYAYIKCNARSVTFDEKFNTPCWKEKCYSYDAAFPKLVHYISQAEISSYTIQMIQTGYGNPFGYAMRSTDRSLMEALVQYDLTNKDSMKPFAVQEYLRAAMNIFKFGRAYLETSMVSRWMTDPQCVQFVERIVDSLCRDPSIRDRTVLLSLFLPALKQTPDQDAILLATEYAECVKIYLRTVDKPYVTARDMEYFFKYMYGEDASVQTAVESYKSLFQPDSCMPPGPKPLKHLCRCTVRKHLQKGTSRTLPSLVRDLKVPKLIKSYILCKF